jgi:hypothetical protein
MTFWRKKYLDRDQEYFGYFTIIVKI